MSEFDPLVSMATERLKDKIIESLNRLKSSSIHDLSIEIGEDDSIVAASLKRMAENGDIILDINNHLVQLS